MATPEGRHQYAHENHRLERFVFADASSRAAGSGLTTPSGVPYTIVAADIGQVAYQSDNQTYWRLTAVGALAWLQLTLAGGMGMAFDGAYTSANQDGTTISAGMATAVHSSGTGIVHADATGATKQAVGLAKVDIAAAASGEVQVGGPLTLSDWTAVAGSTHLSAMAVYFLSTTPGLLTTTPPSTGGNVVQKVGRAVSTTTMVIEAELAILL